MTANAAPWRQSAAPAFTTVSARTTLSRTETQLSKVQPPPAATAAPKKVDWPLSVREYVQRTFSQENRITGIEKEEMEVMLKRVITEAAESEKLFEVDWETYPLPQELIQRERIESLRTAPSNAPWRAAPIPADRHTSLTGQTDTLSLSASKKRKSTDASPHDGVDDDSAPPWRKANKTNLFEDRITYANQEHADRVEKKQRKNQEFNAKGLSKYQADLDKRKQRFQNGKPGSVSTPPWRSSREESPAQAETGPVVGTCLELEKKYFRLTSAPKPEAVRPQHVLEKTLELLKKKWRLEKNYGYVCDQFKSLRQDLTVQRIKNEFTVSVYEIHARIALEKGDLGEYNQCQTQLRALYEEKLGGHPAEFLAYRILYYIHMGDRTGMNEVLANLTLADKTQPAVKHALDVRSALALGNYHKFFKLYLETPNMGAYLMDMFVGRQRILALANISKAYKTNIKVRFLTEELGFESDNECAQFIIDHGGQNYLAENDGEFEFKPGAFTVFENAKSAAFRKIDLKGQI